MTERQLTEWITPEAEATIERTSACRSSDPADVARLVLWLAADDCRACTAQRWVVDGDGCVMSPPQRRQAPGPPRPSGRGFTLK